jgi:hypothetical protein
VGTDLHDVVLVIDAFHHFGDLVQDVTTPFARILFGSNLLYCMQEGLHAGGAGLGVAYGTANYEKLLVDAGYASVGHRDAEGGFTLVTGSAV